MGPGADIGKEEPANSRFGAGFPRTKQPGRGVRRGRCRYCDGPGTFAVLSLHETPARVLRCSAVTYFYFNFPSKPPHCGFPPLLESHGPAGSEWALSPGETPRAGLPLFQQEGAAQGALPCVPTCGATTTRRPHIPHCKAQTPTPPSNAPLLPGPLSPSCNAAPRALLQCSSHLQSQCPPGNAHRPRAQPPQFPPFRLPRCPQAPPTAASPAHRQWPRPFPEPRHTGSSHASSRSPAHRQ